MVILTFRTIYHRVHWWSGAEWVNNYKVVTSPSLGCSPKFQFFFWKSKLCSYTHNCGANRNICPSVPIAIQPTTERSQQPPGALVRLVRPPPNPVHPVTHSLWPNIIKYHVLNFFFIWMRSSKIIKHPPMTVHPPALCAILWLTSSHQM